MSEPTYMKKWDTDREIADNMTKTLKAEFPNAKETQIYSIIGDIVEAGWDYEDDEEEILEKTRDALHKAE